MHVVKVFYDFSAVGSLARAGSAKYKHDFEFLGEKPSKERLLSADGEPVFGYGCDIDGGDSIRVEVLQHFGHQVAI